MKQKLVTVVILAGGLATRLRPISETLPKALIPINNDPFIFHQLHLLKYQGAKRIVLCVGYLGEMIQQAVGNGSQFGLEVEYSYDFDEGDSSNLLGTAGAIKKALPLLDECFFVLYGDSYLLCDYEAVQTYFSNVNKLALMTVHHNQGMWDKSNVEFVDGKIIDYGKQHYHESMKYIDYGLGMFKREAFDIITTSRYDLATLYQELLKQNTLIGFEVKQRFYEIGSFNGIKELETYLSCQRNLISNGLLAIDPFT